MAQQKRITLFIILSLSCFAGCKDRQEQSPVSLPESTPFFEDATADVGLKFVHNPGDFTEFAMPQIMSGGGVWADLNSDGRADLLFSNGGHASAIRSPAFYLAAQETFQESSAVAGFSIPMAGTGVAVGDIDNDGFPDVLLTGVGDTQLWVNRGDGTFQRARCPQLPRTWSTSATFGPLGNEGLLDLVIVNYLTYKEGDYCEDTGGGQEFCGPTSFPGTADTLMRNQGEALADGSPKLFNVSEQAGLLQANGKGLAVIIADLTEDQLPDILVANDMVANQLWVQQSDRTFVDEAMLRGVAFNWLGEAEAGMGIVTGDLTGHGRFELLMTHLRGQTHTLYTQHDSGAFLDETAPSGLAVASLASTGFGAVAEDLNLDGQLEILIANGKVQREARQLTGDSAEPIHYAEQNQMLIREGHLLKSYHCADDPFFSARDISHGILTADHDHDGDLDVVVVNCHGPARFYRNQAVRKGHWLQIRLLDSIGNRAGIGATITIACGDRKFIRRLIVGGGYQTGRDRRVHFGCPSTDIDDVTVTWSDGTIESFGPVTSDQSLILRRGNGVLTDVR